MQNLGGVFWQLCHKIIMVPGKNTIKQRVFQQMPENNGVM
jgi:hypothetical protein